jgi:hypothetical protein
VLFGFLTYSASHVHHHTGSSGGNPHHHHNHQDNKTNHSRAKGIMNVCALVSYILILFLRPTLVPPSYSCSSVLLVYNFFSIFPSVFLSFCLCCPRILFIAMMISETDCYLLTSLVQDATTSDGNGNGTSENDDNNDFLYNKSLERGKTKRAKVDSTESTPALSPTPLATPTLSPATPIISPTPIAEHIPTIAILQEISIGGTTASTT